MLYGSSCKISNIKTQKSIKNLTWIFVDNLLHRNLINHFFRQADNSGESQSVLEDYPDFKQINKISQNNSKSNIYFKYDYAYTYSTRSIYTSCTYGSHGALEISFE